MLAGDTAAELNARAQRGRSSLDHSIEFAWRAHIEEYVRMKVAVAGMKDVSDAKVKLFTDLRHTLHHFRQLAARHYTILHVIIRREGAHCPKRSFSALPQELSFGFVFGDADLSRTVSLADSAGRIHGTFGLFTKTFDFDNQYRVGIPRKTHRRPGFHCFNSSPVHYLQSGRNDTRGSNIDHALGRGVHPLEDRKQGAHRFPRLHEFYSNLGNYSHGSL